MNTCVICVVQIYSILMNIQLLHMSRLKKILLVVIGITECYILLKLSRRA